MPKSHKLCAGDMDTSNISQKFSSPILLKFTQFIFIIFLETGSLNDCALSKPTIQCTHFTLQVIYLNFGVMTGYSKSQIMY